MQEIRPGLMGVRRAEVLPLIQSRFIKRLAKALVPGGAGAFFFALGRPSQPLRGMGSLEKPRTNLRNPKSLEKRCRVWCLAACVSEGTDVQDHPAQKYIQLRRLSLGGRAPFFVPSGSLSHVFWLWMAGGILGMVLPAPRKAFAGFGISGM